MNGKREERLVDRIERGAFIALFDDNGSAGDAEILNDIKNDVEEEERRARPRRNAPIPNRYLHRIYSVNNYDVTDDCCRNDFQEVEGFGADEARRVADNVESTDEQEVDQVEVAGRAFIAAHLYLQTPGETGRTIGKTRGALRGMWMNMVPKFHEGNLQNQTVPGKGFGGGPKPVGRPRGGVFQGQETRRRRCGRGERTGIRVSEGRWQRPWDEG